MNIATIIPAQSTPATTMTASLHGSAFIVRVEGPEGSTAFVFRPVPGESECEFIDSARSFDKLSAIVDAINKESES